METTEIFDHITQELSQTYRKKNHDYGNSFSNSFKEFGLISSVVRLSDKMERLKSFAKLCPEAMRVKDESVQDTLLDMANYAIMTVIELRKTAST